MEILLVEDDIHDAEMVDIVLGRGSPEKFTIHRVTTLAEALAVLDQRAFDCVLVDLNLPDANGEESVEAIVVARNRIPVIVLSGNTDEELAVRLIRAGAQDYLVKGDSGFATLARSLRYSVERKAAELRLKHLASYDPLTSLANRQELYVQLEKACAHASRHGDMAALLLIDLDRFKLVNDMHGHAAGDGLLRGFAERLAGSIRTGDTAARLGGDEFAVVLDGIGCQADALAWCAKALDTLQAPLNFDNLSFPISASIGGALYPTHGADVDTLMRSADIAMYKVKRSGRNGVALYDEHMDRRLVRHKELESQLREALQSGAISAHLQPQLSISSGRVVGFEALARWEQGDEPSVLPGEFLEVARKYRLMDQLGNRILKDAVEVIRTWMRSGIRPVPISINVDPQELSHPDYARGMLAMLRSEGIDRSLIGVEITETTLLEQNDVTLANLEALKAAGVCVALDDFGAGHSSLTYLRRFPIDTLKIDRELVSGISEDQHGETILRAIVMLGRDLGLTIVAEGVETAAQLGVLRGMGCDQAQGYLIARPMPLDEATRWILRGADRMLERLGNLTGQFAALDPAALPIGPPPDQRSFVKSTTVGQHSWERHPAAKAAGRPHRDPRAAFRPPSRQDAAPTVRSAVPRRSVTRRQHDGVEPVVDDRVQRFAELSEMRGLADIAVGVQSVGHRNVARRIRRRMDDDRDIGEARVVFDFPKYVAAVLARHVEVEQYQIRLPAFGVPEIRDGIDAVARADDLQRAVHRMQRFHGQRNVGRIVVDDHQQFGDFANWGHRRPNSAT